MTNGYEGAPARRGGGGRLIVALVLVVVALVSYYSKTQVNPVTGEKQHVAMNVDQEKALGLESAPQMAREMGGALDPGTDPQARLVAELGQKLVARSSAGRSPYADNFHFYLLADTKTVNAFALPGGQIFFTRGLFSRLSNESQVAAVLGHEIGHVIHRHSAEQMAKGQLGQMLGGAIAVGADDGSGRGRSAAMAAAMVNQMIQLKYGRGDESESDQYGLQALGHARPDVRAQGIERRRPPTGDPLLAPPARHAHRRHTHVAEAALSRRDSREPGQRRSAARGLDRTIHEVCLLFLMNSPMSLRLNCHARQIARPLE